MTVRAVFFDAGNTLLWLDYAAIVRAVERRVDERDVARADAGTRRALDAWMLPEIEAGRFPPQETWMEGRPLADVLLDALPVDAPQRDRARGVLAELDRAFELWTVVPPQAAPTLERLRRRGLKLGVVSNADGRVAWKLRQVGLAGYFDAIVDSGIEGVGKPSPEIFRRAMARVGVAPSESAYVGDIYSIDVVGASRAGMHAILFDRTGLYGGFECPRAVELRELERLI
jgi:HAD superfamily hydrolase (TIGR01509 family)